MGRASKKQGQKQCQKQCQQPTSPVCGLPGCERFAGSPSVCCGERVCGECIYGLVGFEGHCCHNVPKFSFKCPFCRTVVGFPEPILKDALGRYCPSHAKIMDNKAGGEVVVAHKPCDTGCYSCEKSTIVVREL